MSLQENAQMNLLCDALVALASREDAYSLLEDLCTIQEVQSMAQRIDVARLLREGATYQQVAAQTGASSATISRVNRCLQYGAGGYRIVLEQTADREG